MSVATSVRGDTLSGAVPSGWNANLLYTLPSYVPGVYYWNNDSGDGHQANIGWCLVGGAQCGMQHPPGYLPYYLASGLAPANMQFISGGNSFTATLQLTLTDQKGGANGINLFGFYETDASGIPITNPTVIFTSNDANGNQYSAPAVTLSPGQNYGFFAENIQGFGTPYETEYTFYMNAADNVATGSMPADHLQHFAVFGSGTTYYLGVVDADACQGIFQPTTSPCVPASLFDFNDFVVRIDTTAAAAPEPGTVTLLGGALLLVIGFRRRAKTG